MNLLYESFPAEILFQIFNFLPLEDVFGKLIYVDRKLNQFLSSVAFKMQLIKQILPIQLQNKISKQSFAPILKSKLNNPKNIELPFWGIRTNGGIFQFYNPCIFKGCAYDHLKFWVAKTFIKSQESLVALSKRQESLFIEGSLSYDVDQFKSLIIRIQRIMNLIQKKNQNQCLKISQIKISDVFNEIFRFYHQDFQIEEALFEEFLKSSELLWLYINKVTDALTMAIEKDPYKLEDLIYLNHIIRMDNRLAYINSIEINRNANLLDIIRTMIIYVTEEESFPSSFAPDLKNCRNETELLNFLKKQKTYNTDKNEITYKVQKTNSMILENVAEEFDASMSKIDDFSSISYCTFQKSQSSISPLIWVRFPKFHMKREKTYKFFIKLSSHERRLCKNVHVRFLDGEQITSFDKELFYGFGLAYIRFKGQLLDENTFVIIKQ